MKPTLKRLKEVLRYDPDAGIFTWRIDIRGGRNKAFVKARAGTIAGFKGGCGYWVISVDGWRTGAHRMAWFYMTGKWPHEIDHLNGNRSDNKWLNLREVVRRVNAQNLKHSHVDSETGFLGVERKRNKFAARIMVDGKRIHIGVFETAKLAHAAYVKAKRELHEGCTI